MIIAGEKQIGKEPAARVYIQIPAHPEQRENSGKNSSIDLEKSSDKNHNKVVVGSNKTSSLTPRDFESNVVTIERKKDCEMQSFSKGKYKKSCNTTFKCYFQIPLLWMV